MTHCPECGAELVALRSQYVKLCSNGKCGASFAWNLDDGQPPLLSNSRDTRKDKSNDL